MPQPFRPLLLASRPLALAALLAMLAACQPDRRATDSESPASPPSVATASAPTTVPGLTLPGAAEPPPPLQPSPPQPPRPPAPTTGYPFAVECASRGFVAEDLMKQQGKRAEALVPVLKQLSQRARAEAIQLRGPRSNEELDRDIARAVADHASLETESLLQVTVQRCGRFADAKALQKAIEAAKAVQAR